MSWSGVTYKAYLDFVSGRDDLEYLTVDTDQGCGVIRHKEENGERHGPADQEHQELSVAGGDLIDRWRSIGDDFRSGFQLLQANRTKLLKLISAAEFLRVERLHGGGKSS
jgi:hypothetical protein